MRTIPAAFGSTPILATAATLVLAAPLAGQDPAGTFVAGEPLDVMDNTRIYGSFHFTESCSYDPERNLILAPSLGNRGAAGDDDGYVSLINPDGSVHTLKWIGATRTGLTLHDPLGSDIANGRFWVVDRNVVRSFDLATGAPVGSVEVEDATGFNDLAVGRDGTIYMSQTGSADGAVPERVYRLTPDGRSSVFVDGVPLARPNGVAFDPDGNVVVVNVGSADILTFSPQGRLVRTERSLDAGNDGLVILPDGTKYVSSVREGTIARIRPGQDADLIASGIPSAASMCHDTRQNQLVVPMNSWFSLAFVQLEG